MKITPLRAAVLFHAGRRADRQAEAHCRLSNFAYHPKNKVCPSVLCSAAV